MPRHEHDPRTPSFSAEIEHPAESTPIGRNAHSGTSDKCNKSLQQNAGEPGSVFQCRNYRILLNSNVRRQETIPKISSEFISIGLNLVIGAGYAPYHDRPLGVVRCVCVDLFFHEFRRPMPRLYEMGVYGLSNVLPVLSIRFKHFQVGSVLPVGLTEITTEHKHRSFECRISTQQLNQLGVKTIQTSAQDSVTRSESLNNRNHDYRIFAVFSEFCRFFRNFMTG